MSPDYSMAGRVGLRSSEFGKEGDTALHSFWTCSIGISCGVFLCIILRLHFCVTYLIKLTAIVEAPKLL